MHVYNVHERTLAMSAKEAGRRLDSLATPADRVWPRDRWPAMRFDRPGLEVGAAGGHGPIRYVVEAYEPGRSARFRFDGMPGVRGEHGFEIVPVGEDRCVGRHVVSAELHGRFAWQWRLVIERLHDVVVEECLDNLAGVPHRPLSLDVRLARWVLSRLAPAPAQPAPRASATRRMA